MFGIIRTKAFAILVGTFGVGIISQIINFNSLIIFASTVGIPIGLTKYVSIWEKENCWEDIRLIVKQFNTILLLFGILATAASIFFSHQISYFLFSSEEYQLLIILASISIPLALLSPVFEAVIKGLKRFDYYVKISVITAVLSLFGTLTLVYFYRIEGAILSLTLSSVIIFSFYFFYLKKTNLIKSSEFISFDFHYSDKFKLIVKLGAASLIVGLADQLSQIIIRTIIIKNLGLNSNGIYQSIYAISANYFSVLFMSLGVYLLPVLSEIKDKSLVNIEINSTLKLTLIVVVPLICCIFIFRIFIILLFYSKEFLPSTDLLFFNFLGDYFKAFSWIIGAWLIPLSRVRAWLIFSIIYYLNFLLIFMIALYFFDLGLKSVVISYFIAYLIHSVINLYYIIKYNDFKFSPVNRKLFPLSVIFIFSLLLVSNYSTIMGYIIIVPSIIIWFKLAVTKEEFTKGLVLVKSKIFKN